METIADGLGGLDLTRTAAIEEVDGRSYSYFAEGDLLLAKVTPCFENGKKALARGLKNGIGFATSEVHVIRPNNSKILPTFLMYVLSSEGFRAAAMASMTGAGGLRRIAETAILDHRLLITDLPTQHDIADFLDRETARIDQLIEKKERLIKVANLRQAARLDEMTFSSAELPGWRRVPFKWCCRLPTGQVDPKEEPWSQMPLIAPNHIESGTGRVLSIESAMQQGAESGKYVYPAGSVLYSKIRPALAKACIAPQQGLCSADMYPITPSSKLLPGFLLMQLLSRTFTDWAVTESMRVAMPKVNRETLGRFPLILAPIERQHELVAEWTAQTAQTRTLADKIRSSIEGLADLRSALITAAVTGQIDVTSWGTRGETDRRLESIEHELEEDRNEVAV